MSLDKLRIDCEPSASLLTSHFDPIPYLNSYFSVGTKYNFKNRPLTFNVFQGILKDVRFSFGYILEKYLTTCSFDFHTLIFNNALLEPHTEDDASELDMVLEYELNLPIFYDDECFGESNYYQGQVWYNTMGQTCICKNSSIICSDS